MSTNRVQALLILSSAFLAAAGNGISMVAFPWLVLQRTGSAVDASIVAAAATLPDHLSPWAMFLSADPLVQAVMLGLVVASIATWTIWLAKSIEIARAAWTQVQAIEAKGGLINALAAGLVADEVAKVVAARDPKPRIVGVTAFPPTQQAPVEVERVTPKAVDAPSPRLPGPARWRWSPVPPPASGSRPCACWRCAART